MKILFITNTLPPVVDGVGDYTLNLAREFARHGHQAGILCKRDDRVRHDYADIAVYPIVEKWNRTSAKHVSNLIKEKKIDVVSLQYVPHGFEPHGLPFGLVGFVKEVKKTGVSVFTFCHEVYWRYRGLNLKYLVESLLMASISKRILAKSDYVATSISYYAKMILSLSGKKAMAIPIASNIPVKYDKNEISELRRKIAPNNELIVAFIGKRDMSVVSVALEKLIYEGIKIKILLIGKTNDVVNIGEKYCYRTGLLDIDELSKYVAVADCMIMPEGQMGCSFKSGSLAAALSFGLPVVTSQGIMTDKVLQDGKNIFFVRYSSVDDYNKVILSMANQESLRKGVSKNAKMLGYKMPWVSTYQKYMEIMNL